ncbi:TetR/AcrR family transcriptional regulator [Streptomyces sp. NBC_00536]|uniref:TetR/AcrR family transcriptional regulator n=1 Tax=Streptomyces sp. NBC_00536 TaxID=2975769 RepID=UPI002E80F46E|nr:TetR family transcriptional regulator [Streptomyces sp. NBC_00536]WUC82509.1 TetR/AcrR family transcriptional regulator [Streptomyces sp. NBC_00536]
MDNTSAPQATGLREAKKQRTRQLLAATALELFLERGFDAVSVADVAAAAEVSKPTLFRYYPSKEDLLLDRFADHQDEAARVVRERPAGQTPVEALHAHFIAGLAAHDPITGLCDHPNVVVFQRLLYSTASLEARLANYTAREVELLAAVLAAEAEAETEAESRGAVQAEVEAGPVATGAVGAPSLPARLAALYLVTARRELGRANWLRMDAGQSAAEALPAAVADADAAFAMLAEGLNRTLPGRTPLAPTPAPTPAPTSTPSGTDQ